MAGIVLIVSRNDDKGTIPAVCLYTFAWLTASSNSSAFRDLDIYSIVSLILGGIILVKYLSDNRRNKRELLDGVYKSLYPEPDEDIPPTQKKGSYSVSNSNPATPISNFTSSDYIEELEKLAQLKEKGIITEEEFETKKKQILGL